MDTSGQVRQHVLIAAGLIDQYQEAMARMMTAWQESDDAEMSVTRAEVERVYTGIWEQLDTAARLTEHAGRSTESFRQLRSTPGLEVGAAIGDVQERVVGMTPGIGKTTVKSRLTVTHNADGVALARRATTALQESWPEVDWTPPETPDVDLRPGGLGRIVEGLARLFGKKSGRS